jgi:hypothetical protein
MLAWLNAVSPPPPQKKEFEPTPAEIKILLGLAASSSGYLNVVIFDGGFDVAIDGTGLSGMGDGETAVRLHEAIDRLHHLGLIIDLNGSETIFHLSSAGRSAVKQIREQIAGFEKPDYSEIERLMPDLLRKMKADYTNHPLCREIIVMDSERNNYNGSGVFIYYRSTHPDLDSMLQILENHEFLQNITYNNVDRYRVAEQFARYLTEQ